MIRLQLEREKRGLSKAELARRAKMQPGDVGKIESGRAKPYDVQLKKLGRAMRLRVAESLTLGDEVATEASALAEVERAGEVIEASRQLVERINGVLQLDHAATCQQCGVLLGENELHAGKTVCDACAYAADNVGQSETPEAPNDGCV